MPIRLSPAVRAAIKSEAKLELLLLLEQGAWSALELARELGRKQVTVQYHLDGLVALGLVAEVSREPVSGGARVFYAAVGVGWKDAVEQLNGLDAGSEQ